LIPPSGEVAGFRINGVNAEDRSSEGLSGAGDVNGDGLDDLVIGADKIDLLTQGGAATGAPTAFTRAADSATTNANTIVANVFTDADGATIGNQALGLNSAALVLDGTSTYLIVNDGTAGFQSANDLVINLTGITGTLPAFGSIPVATFFV
jgi:hypothetical protein